MFGSTGGQSAQNATSLARASRASRVATRAGRIVRIVRLVRLVKLYKHAQQVLMEKKNVPFMEEEQGGEPQDPGERGGNREGTLVQRQDSNLKSIQNTVINPLDKKESRKKIDGTIIASNHALPEERAPNREESKREKSDAFADKYKKQLTNQNNNNPNNGNNNSKEFVNNHSKSREFGEKTSGMPATTAVVQESNTKDALVNNVFKNKKNKFFSIFQDSTRNQCR